MIGWTNKLIALSLAAFVSRAPAAIGASPSNASSLAAAPAGDPQYDSVIIANVLRDLAEAAFKANGFPNVQVTAIHVSDASKKTRDLVHKLLVENEKSANDLLLWNVNDYDRNLFELKLSQS